MFYSGFYLFHDFDNGLYCFLFVLCFLLVFKLHCYSLEMVMFTRMEEVF